MIKEIFPGVKIYIDKFDKIDSFKGKEKFQKTLDEIFDKFEIINSSTTERYGSSRTTVQHAKEYSLPKTLDLKNNELGQWLYSSISKGARELHVNDNKNYDNFKFVRSWTNRMYKDSHAAAHRHETFCDVVCMFYYEAPPNCSELVFVNDILATKNTTPYYDFPKDKRYHIQPESGLFICHSPDIPHAVGVNKTDKPRTVLVFEPFFELND